ncbi:uncharacterized protein CLUP02_00020 [Colletotrichum lupini]|uniref:Uncharacterized protein n=1 Tax=Colletotrichum lupini TaxID=145971 RepID=A0A9Q8SAH8_9PEZI|nr:uncharacterized protein CLUP02_00020 [Colletotrichum lupini]KAK1718902.1 hypothetical protein BDP67DRAFT_169010 [Colletotrichum lupini]UQC73376.1 hypothetical protein CLUP02_00020 [Colletotrichum lupini]
MPIRSLVMLKQTISAHRRARRGTGRVLPARTRPVRLQATRATSIRPRCPPGSCCYCCEHHRHWPGQCASFLFQLAEGGTRKTQSSTPTLRAHSHYS